MKKTTTIPFIQIILLTCVIALGIFLRLYHITTAPNGLLTDEASFGYNAYSVLQTGKDEFGTPYPLSIKSFGDYKYPAYVYASVIPIKLFGLNIFAVRFVSIFSGIVLIIVIFLLLKELGFNFRSCLVGSLIAAISPWTVLMSRFAFESNLGMLIFSVGLLFLLYGMNKSRLYFFLGAGFFFGLSWYCYLPFRPISLLMILYFSIYVLFKRLQPFKNVIVLFFIFMVIISPLLPIMLSKEGTNRMKQNGMFTNPQLKMTINENRTFCTTGASKILCYLNSNKPLDYARIVLTRYADMFSLHYLFLTGESQRYLSVENFGLFPFFLIPYFLFGLFFVFHKPIGAVKKYLPVFLVSGLLISGLPSAVLPTPPIRTQLTAQFPFMLILIVYGFSVVDNKIKNKLHQFLLMAALICFGLVYLFNYIYIHVPKHEDNWEYIQKLIVYLGRQSNTTIYMKPFIGEPMVFYAFFNHIPPAEYQKTVKLGPITDEGFQHVIGLRNVHITRESWIDIACKARSLSNRALYVTDEKFEARPIFIGKSTSGVATLAYVYDLKKLLPTESLCK